MKYGKYQFNEITEACPQQFDVFNLRDNKLAAYVRIRHGVFTVRCPYCGGEEVLSMNVRGDGRLDMEEQEMVLTQAVLAIDHYYAPEDPYF